MTADSAGAFYQEACDLWSYISSTPEEELGDRSSAINNLVFDRLRKALRCDPGHLAAREMLVRLMADELGAYTEAFPEADELARRAPENVSYRELREQVRRRAKEDWDGIPDE